MPTTTGPLTELLQALPVSAQREVRDFVEFLLTKHRRAAGTMLRQDWAGALHDNREQYTSLELQQKALDWRSE